MQIVNYIPLAWLVVSQMVVLIAQIVWGETHVLSRKAAVATGANMAIALLLTLLLVQEVGEDMWSIWDHTAFGMQCVLLVLAGFVVILGKDWLLQHALPQPEYYALMVFSVVGMCLTMSANHLISWFMSMELMYLPLYAMVGLCRDAETSAEAAFKYFITGSLASIFMLYGASFIYSATGAMNFSGLAEAVERIASGQAVDAGLLSQTGQYVLLCVGVALLMGGWLFKMGVAPWHVWVADVYQGAPIPVVMLVGSLPKLVLLVLGQRWWLEVFYPLVDWWQMPLMLLGLLSVFWGNLAALRQKNLQRLLGYSSVAHMGFVSMAFALASRYGVASAQIYTLVYVASSILAFGILAAVQDARQAVEWEDLRGLAQDAPWYSLAIMVMALSMAGIPLFAGFMVKMKLMYGLIYWGWYRVAVASMVASIPAVYYYIQWIRWPYFMADETQQSVAMTSHAVPRLTMGFLAVMLVYYGIFPEDLITLAWRLLSNAV